MQGAGVHGGAKLRGDRVGRGVGVTLGVLGLGETWLGGMGGMANGVGCVGVAWATFGLCSTWPIRGDGGVCGLARLGEAGEDWCHVCGLVDTVRDWICAWGAWEELV
ncbi:hypothetical protein PIB30_084324 [Stylosanthes scabra]|uniref:Uncharacterized protein n=1 Tax=Stylosanthes scabra TaxID=79078 RepID=A0ABU6QTD0_9FABA|nr:hypothetical protein [Stylosanthes scabra]